MNDLRRAVDIETLARMAARLAGRDPDEHVTITFAGQIVFKGFSWSYPDFLARAEAALDVLNTATLMVPGSNPVRHRSGAANARLSRDRR